MSIKQVEIRAFSGPESVELDGIDQPHVVQINQGPAGAAGAAGVGVPAGGAEGQILVKTSAADYATQWVDSSAKALVSTVRNETNTTLTKGTVVYISGASNGKPLVSKASASTEAMSSKTFAILSQDIPHNQNGQAVAAGLLRGLNTIGYTPGANIWLSTTPGQFTQTVPTPPDNSVFLGNIVAVHQQQGEIEVRIQNGYELGELHNVVVTGASGGEVLRYNGTTTLWEDVAATELPIVSTVVARDSLGGSTFTSVTYNSVADSDFSAILRSSNDGSLESTPIIDLPLVSGGLLVDANNLSELSDFATARTNLGLGTTDSPTFKDLTIATGTITTSNPVEVTQTWNGVGVTFTGLKLNATDTNSASSSLLMDLQVGGTSRFKVDKAGRIYAGNGSTAAPIFYAGDAEIFQAYGTGFGTQPLRVSASGGLSLGSSGDVVIVREAAQTLAQRNGTNAQTFRVYGTFTNLTTDYRRVSIKMSTAGVGEIAPEGGSSTATGNMILFKPGDNIVTEAADFTLSEASHAGRYVRLTKTGSTQTITLPTTGVSTGAEFQFYRVTSQTLAFSGGTVNGSSNLSTVPQNGAFALKYLGSGTYDFI